MTIYDTREGARLAINRQRKGHLESLGPFPRGTRWGTVREDYSPNVPALFLHFS
jgi:hypothetical protein